MTRKSKDGFSLVELIIVIAIAALLVGFSAFALSYLRTADTKKIANGINSGLSDLKARAMAQNKPAYMHLYVKDGSYWVEITESETCQKKGKEIGSASNPVVCDGTELSGSSVVSFSIRKKDGAFVPVGGAAVPGKITVSRDDDPEYTIVIVKFTGKHYIE